MQIQSVPDYLKKLTMVVKEFSAAEKLAICAAFLGSCTFGYALYLQIHPESSTVPVEEVMAHEEVIEVPSESTLPTPTPINLAVDVSGAVMHPGVYLVSKDERVSDAITKAGGFAKKADKSYVNKTINLAQPIQDAMKIYIPFEGDGEAKGSEIQSITAVPSTQRNTVNVNTASISELDALKGIGAARAQQIVDNRPYSNLEEFSANSGLSAILVTQLTELISF